MKRSDMLTASQKRIRTILERLVGQVDFEADIALCREQKSNVYALISYIGKILKKYKLPLSALPFLSAYIHHGSIDYSLIGSPAYLIGEDGRSISSPTLEQAAIFLSEEPEDTKKKFINILVSPTATQTEIKEFLSLNWELIKSEQLRIIGEEQKRIKQRPQQARDARVQELLKSGKTVVQIQKALNDDVTIPGAYDATDVRNIITRIRQRQATERNV